MEPNHGLLYFVYLTSSRRDEVQVGIEELLSESLWKGFQRLINCKWMSKAYGRTVREIPGQSHRFDLGLIQKQSATGCEEVSYVTW